ncbi:MAG TPA: molybdopterin-guanine dinucleotide biosynthesis protein B [Rhodocyclaceae bacterium]|jgi:molybdopterin-guanine dinucleotide biosynthesis protein B|nr:molybdopterin-guanine dinucleotide biosynthesis protein B [Rhodocyclaceae bacterium]
MMTKKVFGFAGYSGSGKTTLIEALIPRFVAHGLRISLIKHAHHGFDLDKPGKDSYRHREAGATEVFLVSRQRWVLMHELREEPEPTLDEQLERMSPCDLVLVEGFKYTAIPKIEVHRTANGKPLIHPDNPKIVALASDLHVATQLPFFDINDIPAIAEFILQYTGLK